MQERIRNIVLSASLAGYGVWTIRPAAAQSPLDGIANGAKSAGASLADVIARVGAETGPIYGLLGLFCLLSGIILTIVGLFKVVRAASQQNSFIQRDGYGSAVGTLIVATILMSLPVFVDVVSTTMFGNTYDTQGTVTAYANTIVNNAAGTKVAGAVGGVMLFIQFIGWVSIVRGLFLLNAASGQGQVSLGAGLTHIVGGVMAANVVGTLQILEKTTGLSLLKEIAGR